jgi:hypothetical protein
MALATFDTLKYANTLKAAGVPDKQAEAQAAILADALAVNFKELVTKDDLKQALGETEQRLNARIDLVRSDLNAKIDSTRSDLSSRIDSVRSDLSSRIDLVRSDLSSRIDLVRSDLSARIDSLEEKINGQITLLKWMIGLSISLSVAVLVRLFFGRFP